MPILVSGRVQIASKRRRRNVGGHVSMLASKKAIYNCSEGSCWRQRRLNSLASRNAKRSKNRRGAGRELNVTLSQPPRTAFGGEEHDLKWPRARVAAKMRAALLSNRKGEFSIFGGGLSIPDQQCRAIEEGRQRKIEKGRILTLQNFPGSRRNAEKGTENNVMVGMT